MWEIGGDSSAPLCVGGMLLGPAGTPEPPEIAGLRSPGPLGLA